MLVDAFAMDLLRRPQAYDVVLTENLFGDILTDEASMLAGALGMLPSASLGPGTAGAYEPIHRSAPHIPGKGGANTLRALLSAAPLLSRPLNRDEAAPAIAPPVSPALARPPPMRRHDLVVAHGLDRAARLVARRDGRAPGGRVADPNRRGDRLRPYDRPAAHQRRRPTGLCAVQRRE